MTSYNEHEHEHPLVPYRVYIVVWGVLLVLTTITVGVSYADLKHVALFTAALIATVKASLVMLYFMHVRFGRVVVVYMIAAVTITYGIFLGLTFADYSFR